MPKESEKEKMLKLHLNYLVYYLVKEKKLPYTVAMATVLGSQTYRQLTESKMYLNQSRIYILDDFKAELAGHLLF